MIPSLSNSSGVAPSMLISTAVRIRGRIKALKFTYGFITGKDGKNYFFHWSQVDDRSPRTFKQLEQGTTVEFTPTKVEEDDRADSVVAID
jgi:cold shock CspA family protein